MEPHELTFEQWREIYLDLPEGSEAREAALDNMRLTARWKEDWSEMLRIVTEVEGLPIGHELARICSNGIGFAPQKEDAIDVPYQLRRASWLARLAQRIFGPSGRILKEPIDHR